MKEFLKNQSPWMQHFTGFYTMKYLSIESNIPAYHSDLGFTVI